jgi:hypothetical protein
MSRHCQWTCKTGGLLSIRLQRCCIVRLKDRTRPDNDGQESQVDSDVASKSYENLVAKNGAIKENLYNIQKNRRA